MSTFEESRGLRNQTHFEVLEIDLPVITGTCTIGGVDGYGTPLSCDQAWTGEYKTYKFTNSDAPILPGSMYRCINSIAETSVELKPGDGLASRGSLNISFSDFVGQDPNDGAPGVTSTVKDAGTFFGKLSARQVLENKEVRLKLYRLEADGSVDLANGAQTRYYIANSFKYTPAKNIWTLQCKDSLSIVNISEKTWPISEGGFIRQDIDDAVTSIPVDETIDYSSAFAVRLGDEFMEVLSVTNNQTPTASLTVPARGSSIFAPISGELLTRNQSDTHSAGDEVFICDLSDNETIDSLISRVLIDSDLPASLIPSADWAEEVQEWHANDKINTLHSESESVNDVINRVLTGFLMDLWFDSVANEVKLSAISVWKQSSSALTEGKEINAYSIKKQAQDSLRASRALVLYDKTNLADDDDATSYKKGSRFSDNTIIGEELFGKHKDKIFDNNFLLSDSAAQLLTQRYVSRFRLTPFIRSWESDERRMTYSVGDVVDLFTTSDQAFDGTYSGNVRSQIISIKTKYTKSGRAYEAKGMTYEAAFNDGSQLVIDEPAQGLDLYLRAGAPPDAVTVIFVFDGSYSQGDVAIRAGKFAFGSKIIIVLANGADLQANGGNGGTGGSAAYPLPGFGTPGVPIVGAPFNGEDGGVVYDAQGIDTDIYFSGDTSAITPAYPTADGFIRAPSGGSGGFLVDIVLDIGGAGGNGGDGRLPGAGGAGGTVFKDFVFTSGDAGVNGTIDGTTGFGLDGADNDAAKGLAGSGVIDSGATVTFYGADASRYINGRGDH